MLTVLEDRAEFSYRSRSSDEDSFYRRSSTVCSGRGFEQRIKSPGGTKRKRATRRNRKAVNPGSMRLRKNKHWSW
jgi:hypothetical protein